MGPTDEHDDDDHAQDMGTAADDDPIHVPDTKHEEEAKENDTDMLEAEQSAQKVNARPGAHLKEAGGELHGTPKGRTGTLVLALLCCSSCAMSCACSCGNGTLFSPVHSSCTNLCSCCYTTAGWDTSVSLCLWQQLSAKSCPLQQAVFAEHYTWPAAEPGTAERWCDTSGNQWPGQSCKQDPLEDPPAAVC